MLQTPTTPSIDIVKKPIVVVAASRKIAEGTEGILVAESRHNASIYLPLACVTALCLTWGRKAMICDAKGLAIFYDLIVGKRVIRDGAWTYPHPKPAFADLRDHVAFDLAKIDRLIVGGREIPATTMTLPG